MKVRVCKNCEHWRKDEHRDHVGLCVHSGSYWPSTDLTTCSAFDYASRFDDYPSDELRKGNGGGGDDDGPVDITPRGPGGNQITAQKRIPQWPADWKEQMATIVVYDPDGDKKD